MSSIYSYQAVDDNGKVVEGELTAGSPHDIARDLNARNLTVINIEISQIFTKKIKFASSIKAKDKLVFTTYLATMLRAGLSPLSAMDVLISDTKNKAMQATMEEVRGGLERGRSLSSSLAQFPDIFDQSFIAVVKAGETSGSLVESLNNMSLKIRQDEDLISKIKNALIYPAVIFATLLIVGMAIVIFILPKVTKVFDSLKIDLPVTTKALMFTTKLISYNYILSIGSILFIVAGAALFIRSRKGKNWLNWLANKTPYLKSISRAIDLARINSTMALLLAAGVPIEKVIGIVGEIAASHDLQKILSVAKERIKSGVGVAQCLKEGSQIHGKAIPEIMIKIIEVGEKTGTLSEALATLAISYRKDADDKIKNFMSLLEPILMVVVGLAVGVLILSIVGPIYKVVGGVAR